MEFFDADMLSALLAIVVIDLVLAGDNALVIGLAARDLPKHMQRRVILWGTLGAVIIRCTMTLAVVWLLKIPGLLLVGGLALVWIARKLLTPDPKATTQHTAARTLGEAIRVIVIADAVMGIDNVIAIGGAARESEVLVVIGLLISVPIVVWGSQLVVKVITRYPWAILIGGLVLAWTAFSMVADERLLQDLFERSPATKLAVGIAILAASIAPWLRQHLQRRHRPLLVLLPGLAVWLLAFNVAGDLLGWRTGTLPADATLWEMALQFVKWTGWLPLAIGWLAVEKRLKSGDVTRTEPAHTV